MAPKEEKLLKEYYEQSGYNNGTPFQEISQEFRDGIAETYDFAFWKLHQAFAEAGRKVIAFLRLN